MEVVGITTAVVWSDWVQRWRISELILQASISDQLHAGADTGIAVLNTYVCTAAALLAWTLCDALYYKRAAILGCVQGMICGTPLSL